MDIQNKEPLYILSQGQEYIVRPDTHGVDKNKVVFFFDTTRTQAVGFSRDYVLENPQTFQVNRNLTDKEVSVRDVVKVIEDTDLPKELYNELITKVKSL